MQKVVLTENNTKSVILQPAILHGIKIEKKISKSQDEVQCASINSGSNVLSICTVPVKIKESSGNKVICTNAFADSCTQATFILEPLRDDLCIPIRETSAPIKTINGEFKIPSKVIDGLQVSGINDDKSAGTLVNNIHEMKFQLIMMTSLNKKN